MFAQQLAQQLNAQLHHAQLQIIAQQQLVAQQHHATQLQNQVIAQ